MAELRGELLGFIASPNADRFDGLALRVAQRQVETIEAYGRWVDHRGGFDHWTEVPWVPTEAFRRFDLCSESPQGTDTIFETSGTTTGSPGRRRAPDMRLYEAAMDRPFVDAVLGGDASRKAWVSLIPESTELPTSSLSHMVSSLASRYADLEHSSWHLRRGGLDVERAAEALRATEGPTVVLATSFALLNLFDAWQGEDARLAQGSRLMLTGGFKGRSRTLDAADLERLIEARLGLPPEAIIGEYGMTEWTSQAYGHGVAPALQAPPWLRLRVIDPLTLQDVAPGQVGLVAAFDLLNLENVSAVLTSDLGSLDEQGRLRLHGRAPSARPRGCGLTALDWGTQA
ncbi:MAG: hypothetical protein CL940_03145 [Deltaproteobacteria bacterium]|nr:hypothetical protein [Deltaproteobacteria bacterium]